MANVDQLPPESALHKYIGADDFVDCYADQIVYTKQSIDDLARGAQFKMPKWALPLLILRNALVKPLGLKTTFSGTQNTKGTIKPGEYVNFFHVAERHDNEVIMGGNDKHLDYRVSVFRDNKTPEKLFVATWVHRNNWLGHAYLFLVMPFHKTIVRNMTRNIAKQKPPQPNG